MTPLNGVQGHDRRTGPADSADGRPASGLYVYALVPADSRLDLAETRGIGDARVHVLPHGDLTVVVSTVELTVLEEVNEEDLSESGVLATLARRHDEVIQAVFGQATVLPLRFGTLVRDRESAVQVAEQCRDQARDLFVRLEGRREWGVRLLRPDGAGTEGTPRVPEGSAPAPAESASQHPAQASTAGSSTSDRDHAAATDEADSGTAYLARRSAALKEREARRRHEERLVEGVETALAGYVAEALRRRPPSPPLLLDLAYLVDQDREPEFLAEVDEQAAAVTAEGLGLETTGPWPPYTFARLELSTSSP